MNVNRKMVAVIPKVITKLKTGVRPEINNEFVCPWSSVGIKLVPATEQISKSEKTFFSPRTPIVINDNTVGEILDFRF